MLVNIIINDKVKIGIVFKATDDVNRVIQKLRIENILPQNINIQDINLLDFNRNPITLNDTIQKLADSSDTETPKLILQIPQKHMNSKLLERNGSQIRVIQQRQTLDKLFKTMKKVFACIQKKKFEEIEKLKSAQTKNPELIDIFCSYSNEFQKYWILSDVYENIIDRFILGNDKNPEKDKFLAQRISSLAVKQKEEATQKLVKLSKKLSSISSCQIDLSIQVIQLKKKLSELEDNVLDSKNNLENQKLECEQMQLRMDNKDEIIHWHENEIQKLQSKIASLQIQIDANREDLSNLKEEIQQKDHDRKNEEITEEIKRQLDFKEAQIQQLIGKTSSFLKKLKDQQSQKINQHLVIQPNQLQQFFSSEILQINCLVNQIQKVRQKRITSFKILYQYQGKSKYAWRDQINYKPDVLLIAKTTQKKIIGGFSSCSIDQAKRGYTKKQLSETSGFLFSSIDQQLIFFGLNKNCHSIEYDSDYLIFGNQQICIQKQGNELSSLFMSLPVKSLHYEDTTRKRQKFISDTNKSIKKVALQRYMVLMVLFQGK